MTDSSTETKFNFLRFGTIAFAGLSITGSLMLLVVLGRTWKTVHKFTTYNRLMLGISFFDLLLSTGIVLGRVPMPEESGVPGARGNEATCRFQGFLLQTGNSSMLYSQMLVLQYMLLISFNVGERKITKYIEPFMHLLPILYGLVSASTALALDLIQPSDGNAHCWIPPPSDDSMVDFPFYVNAIPALTSVFLIVCYVIVIAATVIKRYHHSRRYAFQNTNRHFMEDKRTRQVLEQCLLYALWFTSVGIWGYLATFFNLANKEFDFLGRHFWIVTMAVIFFPLQGFFNFFIYIRPRYISIRQGPLFDEQGRWFAFREAIWYPVETRPSRRASRASSRLSNTGEACNTPMGQILVADKSSGLSRTMNDLESGLSWQGAKVEGLVLPSDGNEDEKSRRDLCHAVNSKEEDELEQVAEGLSLPSDGKKDDKSRRDLIHAANSNEEDELEQVAEGLSESQSTQKSVRFASLTSGEASA